MKKNSYKGKTVEVLLKELSAKRDTLRGVRFGAAGSKSKNVKELRGAKKDVARIMTELNSQKQ